MAAQAATKVIYSSASQAAEATLREMEARKKPVFLSDCHYTGVQINNNQHLTEPCEMNIERRMRDV